ncbi:uncharacterized protein LOC134256108 isoform X2 [Saccostrea cucullata]
MDKMGTGVSQQGNTPASSQPKDSSETFRPPKGSSGRPRPPGDPYQHLYTVLCEYKNGKKSLSVDDVKALQGFIQQHHKDENSPSYLSLTANKEKLANLEKQRQDILNKISEVAGARLKSNNPAIADLSDQNRPSKLAEKFSELYDNEWTDAAEELKQAGEFPEETPEEDIDIAVIKFLFNFAKVTYKECEKKAAEQLQQVRDAVSFHNKNVEEMAVELDRKCRDFIRKHCEITLSEALKILPYNVIKDQKLCKELGITVDQLQNCKHTNDFLKLCARLCWMMALQDPPVYMVTSTDSVEMYRAYTRSGDIIEYVVWPSLLLHKDGPLLYKGVAQFKKKDGKKENSPDVKSQIKSEADNSKTVHTEQPIYENFNGSENNSNNYQDSMKNGTVNPPATKAGDGSAREKHITTINVK